MHLYIQLSTKPKMIVIFLFFLFFFQYVLVPPLKYTLRKCKAAKRRGDYRSDRLCDWPASDTTNHSSSNHHQRYHQPWHVFQVSVFSSNIPAPTAGHGRSEHRRNNSDEMNVTSEEVRFNFRMGDWGVCGGFL